MMLMIINTFICYLYALKLSKQIMAFLILTYCSFAWRPNYVLAKTKFTLDMK